jgi:Protein of unknown function (DUF998)
VNGSRSSRTLLLGGAIAGPAFLAVAIIEGATRPDYNPVRHPVSSLEIGPRGRVQVVNFLLAGTLYVGYAVGLFRLSEGKSRAVPVLIGAAGAGLLGAGTFTTDPVSGYPPGTADQLTERSTAGLLHDLLSLPTFLCVPAAAFIEAGRSFRRGERIWALYSAKSGVVALVSLVLASAGFAQHPRLVNLGGLFQRFSVGTAFAWMTALAIRRLLSGERPASEG